MEGTDRAGLGGNGRFGIEGAIGIQCTGLRTKKCRKSRPPAAKLGEDLCPQLGLGPGRCARSGRAHLEATDCGENRAPASCRCACPLIHPENAHYFWRPNLGCAEQPRSSPSLPAPRLSGEPLPRAWVVWRAPSLGPVQKALEPLSVLSAKLPGSPGHLQIPTEATDPFPPKFSSHPPTLQAGSPGSLSCRSGSRQRVSGQFPLHPTLFCPRAPLTRPAHPHPHADSPLPPCPENLIFFRTSSPLFGPIILIISPRFHAFVALPNTETG